MNASYGRHSIRYHKEKNKGMTPSFSSKEWREMNRSFNSTNTSEHLLCAKHMTVSEVEEMEKTDPDPA